MVETDITWTNVESACKETYQVKEADLVFHENAREEQVLDEMNKEDKEELDQEEKASDLIDQVALIVQEVPIEELMKDHSKQP